MFLIRRTSFVLAVVFALACASDGISAPPGGFPHAFAQFACGPADGPAVAIFLTQEAVEAPSPTTPYVRIYIAQAVDQLNGRAWSIAGSNSQGGAWFQLTADSYEIASSGYIVATNVSADHTIDGSVDLTFPRAGRIRGGFHAPLFPNNALCV